MLETDFKGLSIRRLLKLVRFTPELSELVK